MISAGGQNTVGVDDITLVIEQLESMETSVCGFIHEWSDLYHPVQCPQVKQERMIGCAHSANSILQQAADAALRHELISHEKRTEIHAVLRHSAERLIQLDILSAEEYDSGMSQCSDSITKPQQSLIELKNKIRSELLELLKSVI